MESISSISAARCSVDACWNSCISRAKFLFRYSLRRRRLSVCISIRRRKSSFLSLISFLNFVSLPTTCVLDSVACSTGSCFLLFFLKRRPIHESFFCSESFFSSRMAFCSTRVISRIWHSMRLSVWARSLKVLIMQSTCRLFSANMDLAESIRSSCFSSG